MDNATENLADIVLFSHSEAPFFLSLPSLFGLILLLLILSFSVYWLYKKTNAFALKQLRAALKKGNTSTRYIAHKIAVLIDKQALKTKQSQHLNHLRFSRTPPTRKQIIRFINHLLNTSRT